MFSMQMSQPDCTKKLERKGNLKFHLGYFDGETLVGGNSSCVAMGRTEAPQGQNRQTINQGPKKHGNGNVQANVRANTSGQFEGTAHENVGFRGNKGQKVHPNFAPNITMEISLPCFSLP